MRVAFLGNNDFSVSVLRRLLGSSHEVVCVVGSLDSKVGRGQKVSFSPLKVFAMKNNIPFLQYRRVSSGGEEDIKSFKPDVLVTASFGQILRQNILDLAKYGVINVHTSLLPKYRGSCPANFAIINGEKETGVTIMKTALSLDSGDIILQEKLDILPDETAGELLSRLSEMGGDLLVKALDSIENGTAVYTEQNEDDMTYFPMLYKDFGRIDFNKTGEEIHDFVRGINPWPVAFVTSGDLSLKVYKASAVDNVWDIPLDEYEVGEVVLSSSKTGLVVKCKGGLVSLDEIQASGGKIMSSKAYLNGKKIMPKTLFNGEKND